MSAPTSARLRPALAIAGLSGAIFLLEVLLTRIFSVTLFHHFAFVAISVGMLGFAAAGVRVSLRPDRFPEERAAEDIATAGLLFALSAIAALAILVQIGISPEYSWWRAIALVGVYGVCFVPFYFGGLAVTLLLTHYRRQFAVLYASDLVSAGLGGLLVVPALGGLGAPAGVVAAGLLAALAVLGSSTGLPRRLRWLGWGVVGLGVVALAGDLSTGLLRLRRPKEASQAKVLFEAWNPFSRVAVYDLPMQPWAVGPRYSGPIAHGLHMDIDASAATPIVPSRSEAGSDYLKAELTAAAYAVALRGRALVIGAGGGRDVLSALLFGMQQVDAVEINPIIVNDVMLGRFREVSGDLYSDPRVRVHVLDGRTFVRRSRESYDVIQLSLVDTWAATAAGAFALSENNLYTVEAAQEFVEHLTPQGLLSIVRWHGADTYRLIGLLREAARVLRIEELPRHLAILECPHTPNPSLKLANVIFRRAPFDEPTVAALRRHAEWAGFGWLHDPLQLLPGRTAEIARAPDPVAEARRTEAYELGPSTDDWPFFFYRPVPSFFGGLVEEPQRLFTDGQYLVAEILLLGLVLGFFCLVLPLWRRARAALRTDAGPALVSGIYFVCLGIGFMLVELSMMQRFVLFLGHPTHALMAVVAGLLIGAGLGSAIASRVRDAGRRGTPAVVASGVAVATLVVSNLAQPAVFEAAQHLGFLAKLGLTELLVLPLGASLGTLMPLGIAILTERAPRLVPWAWGLNGFSSVVGSCAAVLLSMSFGFSATFRIGAGVYGAAAVAAAALAWVGRRRAVGDTGEADAGPEA